MEEQFLFIKSLKEFINNFLLESLLPFCGKVFEKISFNFLFKY